MNSCDGNLEHTLNGEFLCDAHTERWNVGWHLTCYILSLVTFVNFLCDDL